jgi:FkbM family methyltransferase
MSVLENALIRISGNYRIQRLLEKRVRRAQYLMGIGAGEEAASSGEKSIFQVLKNRLKPTYCIFDVGSNKGQFLHLILENVSASDCSIHCFEPGHETFKFLTASAPKDHRIRLNNFGIGKEQSEAVLHYNEAGSGLASLTKRRLEHFDIEFEETENVTIDTIDNYCSENKIEHIHLLKIDIEGHELDALEGSKRMFASKSIDLVTFEFGGCNIDTRTYFRDFWYFFEEANFKLFRITPSGYLYPLNTYKEIHEQFRTVNFLAISNK